MNKIFIGASLAAAIIGANSVATAETLDEHGGLYFGLSGGASLLNPEIVDKKYEQDNKSSASYRVSGGYRFGSKLAAEIFFADLGKTQIINQLDKNKKLDIPYQMAGAELIYLPFGKQELKGFDVFGKLGVGSLLADKESYVKQEKNVQFVFGGGIQYIFNHIVAVRLMGEGYDKDAGLVSLGITLSPHTHKAAPEPVIIQEPVPVVVAEPVIKEEPILDTDGDGVADQYDCCPNTAGGLKVNKYGCPVLEQNLQNINFEYRSFELTDYAKAVLDGLVESLKLYSSAKIELGAHTDNIGSLSFNQKLSQKRAESARNYIISRGIAAERISARGYGKTMPIASNATEDGRFQNRRVEIKTIDLGKDIQGCGKEEPPMK